MFKELFENRGDAYETGAEFSASESKKWITKIQKLGYSIERMKYSPKYYYIIFKDITDVTELQKDLDSINFPEKIFQS